MYDDLIKRLRNLSGTDNIVEFDEAADAIEELSKPRWISVEDELPETWKPVLVTYISYNDGEPLADMCAFIDGSGEWTWNDNAELAKVPITHWMPLPEPPKEEA